MLRFFRTLRQRFLTENRFSKYVLYAVGEILLVVIGILIALQINAWNQDRMDRKIESQYYMRFLEDVLLDEELIRTQIEETNRRLLGANRLPGSLQRGSRNMDEIATDLTEAINQSSFKIHPTQTTFEDIKSSGNVHLIKDLELKKILEGYYVFMNGVMDNINDNSSRLAVRMLQKEDVLGAGLVQLARRQNGIADTIVDLAELTRASHLTEENRLVLINDAVYYAALSSRNLHHLSSLKQGV